MSKATHYSKKRKKIIIITFASFVMAIVFSTKINLWNNLRQVSDKQNYTVQVVGIADGDSFTGLTDEKQKLRFRIHGIDAPEKSQPFSNEARKQLSDLIFQKQIKVVMVESDDKYNRKLVQVFTPDGKDVGAEMLKNGLAWQYRRTNNKEDYERYSQLESDAREEKIGLWSQPNPESPWKFRSRNK